jgi:hypothetical protein
VFLSAFIADEKLTVHKSGCSHVVRNWREFGAPIVTNAQSQMGLMRQVKNLGIRVQSVRVMPCAGLPEGFWSHTPSGQPLRLLDTVEGAHRATKRVERIARAEMTHIIDNMSPMLREMFGLSRQS